MTSRMKRAAAIGLLGFGLGCQGQFFDEVPPATLESGTQQMVVADPEALDVMLVVDTSGSMSDPTQDGTVATRWSELTAALLDPETGFLARNRQNARFGLTTFPSHENVCGPGAISEPVGQSEGDNLDRIASALATIVPTGGTPTAQTLALLDDTSFPPAAGRRRLAVLLTDGLPNCNSSTDNALLCDQCNENPEVCQSIDGCRPTFGPPNQCDNFAAPSGSACLDEQGLVAQVEALHALGIDTVVLGFGAQTQGATAVGVLNRAAVAGGWAREAEQRFYQANDKAELTAELEKALRPARCVFKLSRPLDEPDLVSVVLRSPDGKSELALQREVDWSLRSPTELRLLDSRCAQIDSYLDHQMQVRWVSKL